MPSDDNTMRPRELVTPAVLHILLTLAQGQLHGYGIKQAVEERTGGALSLGPGTLYEAIHRLDEEGLIREVDGGGRKRIYRITRTGRQALSEELRRLGEIVDFARDARLLEGEA